MSLQKGKTTVKKKLKSLKDFKVTTRKLFDYHAQIKIVHLKNSFISFQNTLCYQQIIMLKHGSFSYHLENVATQINKNINLFFYLKEK